jgi:hypothetical protein
LDPPYTAVIAEPVDIDLTAANSVPLRPMDIGWFFFWRELSEAGDSEQDRVMRQMNTFEDLVDGIISRAGTAAYARPAALSIELPTKCPDDGDLAGCWFAVVGASWNN